MDVPGAALEFALELAHQPFGFCEYHRDRGRIGSSGDPRRIVAFRRADGQPDQLPGCCEPSHHQDQAIGHEFAMPARSPSSSALTTSSWASDRLRIWPGRRLANVASRSRARRISDTVANVVDGVRRTDLPDQATMQLVILGGRCQRRGDTLGDQILKLPRRRRQRLQDRRPAPRCVRPLPHSEPRPRQQDRDRSRPRSARSRCAQAGPDARRSGMSSTRNGSMGRKNKCATSSTLPTGWTVSRDAWRTSCKRKSPPGTSSPRSKALSSFVFSKARVSGANCRRYCRNRSTGSP